MALLPKRPFRRLRDGRYEVNLDAEERRVLRGLCGELRELLLTDEPRLLRRLFPTAYPDDPAKDAEWQAFSKGQLLEAHFAAIETTEAALDADVLTEAELTGFMQSVNALRLVLGTRLDVSEDPDHRVDPTDPEARLHHLYEYLGWVLTFMVDALSAGLPPPSAE